MRAVRRALRDVQDRLARARRGDTGAVTVEAAIALSSLTIVLVLAIGAVLAVAMQVQCQDAAREAARLTARGESSRAATVAAQVAPSNADVSTSTEGDTVFVRVEASSAVLPGLEISAQAVAVLEPSAEAVP